MIVIQGQALACGKKSDESYKMAIRNTLCGGFACILATAVTGWAIYTPIEFAEGGDKQPSTKRSDVQKEDVNADSVFLTCTTQQLSLTLRPAIKPVVTPTKKKARPVKAVVPAAPPLRTNLALIGTVIQPERKHAVLQAPRNKNIVVFEGDELPKPNGGVRLKTVNQDSVTLSRGSQVETLKLPR